MTENCSEKTTDARISLKDRNRSVIIVNTQKDEYIKTRFDGCVVRNVRAADWVLTREGVADVLIELKGRDVEHGVEQIIATATILRERRVAQAKCAGLIVAQQYPRESTTIQRKRQAFSRAFSGPIHVVTGRRELDYERILRFDGPG